MISVNVNDFVRNIIFEKLRAYFIAEKQRQNDCRKKTIEDMIQLVRSK